MVDQKSRDRLKERNNQKQSEQLLVGGFNQITDSLQTNTTPILRLISAQIGGLIEDLGKSTVETSQKLSETIKQSTVSPKDYKEAQLKLAELFNTQTERISELDSLKDQLQEVVRVLVSLDEKFTKPLNINVVEKPIDINKINSPVDVIIKNQSKIEIPKETKVKGSVDIDNLPPVEVSNLGEITDQLTNLISNLQSTTLQAMTALKIKIPDKFNISNDVSIKDWGVLLDDMEELKKGFNLLIKTTKESKGADNENPMKVEIVADLPRLAPTPVTHISINSLNGFIKTTAATVTTALTPLPTYGVLDNRRAMVVYNNGSETVFVGGSDVTSSNGMPVPAGTYSPPFDNGVRTILYGVTASSSSDVRCLEISDIASGI